MKPLGWLRDVLGSAGAARMTKPSERTERRQIVQDWEARGHVKYEADLDRSLGAEIVGLPGGDALLTCIQCGTCSATCPVSVYMDHTPRKIIAMTRAGFKHDVLRCFTIWLCASCYACTVDCPRQIKITDLMYTLKRKAIEARVYPPRFPIPVLAHEFFHIIARRGRNNEGQLMTRMLLKTNPLLLFRQVGLGLRLLRTGRIQVLEPPNGTASSARDLRVLLAAVEEAASHAPRPVAVHKGATA